MTHELPRGGRFHAPASVVGKTTTYCGAPPGAPGATRRARWEGK
ncbi:hypothetical protein A176_005343 [Myxococcus hansupus]|uniref:Uncharacterized protein n=1 Tax=Pseudomyxococcus hansupus TaxID=1297742 RepID=A0A0H4WYD0_9BACT|nr:hypothetical protein A176_005343 [Myxococcus hansupus]